MTQRLPFSLGVAVIAGAIALQWPASRSASEPLDAGSCERLRTERAALLNAGVLANMSKGAQWAKANLSSSRLGEIGRYLDVEEQLAFRCRNAVPLADPEPEAEPKAEAKPDAPPAPPKRKAPRREPSSQAAGPPAKPEAKDNSGQGAGQSTGSGDAVKTAPRPAPRARSAPAEKNPPASQE